MRSLRPLPMTRRSPRPRAGAAGRGARPAAAGAGGQPVEVLADARRIGPSRVRRCVARLESAQETVECGGARHAGLTAGRGGRPAPTPPWAFPPPPGGVLGAAPLERQRRRGRRSLLLDVVAVGIP